jgi:hypothetical protein
MADDQQQSADAETAAIEAELSRLPDVVAARLVADEIGRPLEVHVLAHTGKHAKQIVRDVQSVALASFGLDIDRRIVSVVQLTPDGEAAPTVKDPSRIKAQGIEVSTTGLRTSIRVTLSADGHATGFAEGAAAATVRPRLVASAALDALRQLERAAGRLDVVGADVVRIGAHDVALVTVVSIEGAMEIHLAGSAIVHQSADDAIVRAVLDSVNRRLPIWIQEQRND